MYAPGRCYLQRVTQQQPRRAAVFLIIVFLSEASFEACLTVTWIDIPIERGDS
jgi:hypothetical protein